MENNLKGVYGSYSIPKEVSQLIQFEEGLQKDGLSLATIGLIPIVEPFFYAVTPPDLIPFAHTGGNGIHFGFLTDFNEVSDLMEAPIVCVSPTNDPRIRYVARNFKEFMNLAVSVPYVEMLEQFWAIQDENQMNEIIRECASYLSVTSQRKRKHIFKRLQQAFEAERVDVLNYIQKVREERANIMSIPTLDGLGIVGQNNGRSYSFANDRSTDEEEIEKMQSYLNVASIEEKLAFVRDANYSYILAPNYDVTVAKLIINLLQSLELKDDATRVSSKL